MCLTVKQDCKPEIAIKDIHCYKYVNPQGRNGADGWKGLFEYSNRIYPWNVLITAEKETCLFGGEYSYTPIKHLELIGNPTHNRWDSTLNHQIITYGFHVLATKPQGKGKYHECIIPAGTEFCYGDSGDIVATNMIVFHKKRDYWKYILKKKLNNK